MGSWARFVNPAPSDAQTIEITRLRAASQGRVPEPGRRGICSAVGQFISGFIFASMLWGAASFLYVEGYLDRYLGDEEETEVVAAVEPEEDATQAQPRRKRRPKHKRRPKGAPRGNAVTGDDIGWDDNDRQIDLEGGEEQLSGREIEQGFDSAFGGIRRCLFLVPGDGETRGKLVFGMRVNGDGRPTAVNLSGPASVTKGEAGACMRKAARGIRFASFDGPEMVFRYPIELE